MSRQTCLNAVLEFVVEVDGQPNAKSARVIKTNDEGFARNLVRRLGRARYRPAERNGEKVRQLVRDTFAIRELGVAPGMGTGAIVPLPACP